MSLYLVLSNVDIASEVCLFTRMSLTDVHSDKVSQAGESGGHLAKLTELGHEGWSGTGAEVDHKRSARSASTEERHCLLGGEVVQSRVRS